MTKQDELTRQLKEAVGNRDMDEVVYRLVKIAVERRNEAEEGVNEEALRHCQSVVEILSNCQRQLEEHD